MNNLAGKGSMSAETPGVGWKTADVVPDQFPAGLRVLVVDDDPICLMILEKMLRTCYYEVTKCNRAALALSLLRENRHGYDIVMSDVHMPDMDGFKLLEHIGLEMDLPVIMMSADDGKQVVMKGVTHGACDYLVKPVGIESLRNIWQHVIRKKKDSDYSSSANEASWRSSKRKKDEDEEGEEMDDASNLKKLGVVWTVELHQQFIRAVDQLGIDKAVPKKILELMNVPGLTRDSVASHLQIYRLHLRQLSVTTGQRPAQSPAVPQASGLGRPAAKARMPLLPVVVDQRNLFSFENHKMGFGASGKQTNLFHGVPTNLVYKEICSFCLMLLLILVMLSISYF